MNFQILKHNRKAIFAGITLLLVLILSFKWSASNKNTSAERKASNSPDKEAYIKTTAYSPSGNGNHQQEITENICQYLDSSKIADYFISESVRNYVYQSFLDFYENRDCQFAWSNMEGPLPPSDSLLAALASAPQEGLMYDYHLDELLEARKRVFAKHHNRQKPDSLQLAQIARLDFLMTASYLTYASHLLSGKADPNQFDVTWIAQPRKRNLAPLLEKAITDNQVQASLQQVIPGHPQYSRLKKVLSDYQAIAENGGWPALPEDVTLQLGDTSEVVALLRKRLAITNDLNTVPGNSSEDVFDYALEEAVKRFQARHGLRSDGIMGENTVASMNIPVEKRIEQLRINLERLRWLPDTLGERYVMVNIPEYRVYVVENDRPVMDMKVVVGRDYNSTPIFRDTIRYVEFSPTWTVPLSIAREEILPILKKDPNYLTRKNFLVYDTWEANATPIGPNQINWRAVSPASFNYKLEQQPGPGNPLGQVKFMFPNKMAIYLHDTPAEHLFDRKKRAFSHGCVRVEKPVDFALYLLDGLPGWDRIRIQESMHLSAPKPVSLPDPIPIQFMYLTSFVDEDGIANFRKDVYGHDQMQIEAIQ